MSRVLVTGAAGYIGRHVINALREAGIATCGLARCPRPNDLLNVEWFQGDVRNISQLSKPVEGCDVIIHLACLPLNKGGKDPKAVFEVNTNGTRNILQVARNANVRRVIYTSTAQIYGYVDELPVAEDAEARPCSPYASSKYFGEVICELFYRAYGLEIIILRLFNVYGMPVTGRMRSTVDAVFLNRVMQGLAPIITSNPEEGRDFVHITDVVRAIMLALESKVSGGVFNVGSGVMTTLLELVNQVVDVSDVNIKPIIEGNLSQRPIRLQADNQKARRELGFVPQVSLIDGLTFMLSKYGN